MDEKNEYMISVRDLHKFYGNNHILKGLNFNMKQGQLISIIGRSGCGKTTLLRCLNCLEVLDAGVIRIAGITLARSHEESMLAHEYIKKSNSKEHKKAKLPFIDVDESYMDEEFRMKAHSVRTSVGLLFQNLNLFPHLTVMENVIKAPMIVKGESREEAMDKAIVQLKRVGMSHFVNRYPYQLSGGQAQRVGIARALAMSPKVMLYDEPTSSLDPELIEEVLDIMRNLHSEGMTQLVVTHAMNFARTASDFVIYMEDGNIVEISSPDVIFSNPQDDRTRRYVKILAE